MLIDELKKWELPYSKEELTARFNDPNRVRYAYWVSDPNHPNGGYEAIIKDPQNAPNGVTVKTVICMG